MAMVMHEGDPMAMFYMCAGSSWLGDPMVGHIVAATTDCRRGYSLDS